MAATITQRPDNGPHATPETAWAAILAEAEKTCPGITALDASKRNRVIISGISGAMRASGAAPEPEPVT